MSSAAWHVDAGTHTPPRQLVEQQSTPERHACPSTLQELVLPLIGWQMPPEQVPLQQLLLAEHAP
jgi:hypothetical protein